MKHKTKPPKPVQKAAKRQAKDQLANLKRRLEKIDADRKAQRKLEPKKKRGRPPKPQPDAAGLYHDRPGTGGRIVPGKSRRLPSQQKPQPKERKMVRHRKSDTGEDIELYDAKAAEPTKVYIFHLNLVTPAVEATETEPAIPEYTEQQAEGVRWSDRTYTMHWTAQGPAVGYVTFPSLRHLHDTYPKLTVVFVDSPDLVDPYKDDEAADLELRQKESDAAAIAAKEARARAEEAKARVEARHEHA